MAGQEAQLRGSGFPGKCSEVLQVGYIEQLVIVWQVVWVRCSLHAPGLAQHCSKSFLSSCARPAVPAQLLVHGMPLLSSFTSVQLLQPCALH